MSLSLNSARVVRFAICLRNAKSGRSAPRKATHFVNALLSGLVLCSCLTIVSGTAVFGSTGIRPAKALTPLQKGIAFYSHKTIILVAPSAAGNGYDLVGRTIQPFLDSYLHTTVEVVDIASGGGVAAEDQVAGTTPDGLTIGILNEDSIISSQLSGGTSVNFNPERESFIAGTAGTPTVVVSQPSSSITSFKALESSTVPVKTLVETNSGGTGIVRALYGVLKIPAQYITGYASQSNLATGFLRGDGTVVYASATTFDPLIAAGQAKVLAISVKPPVGMVDRSYLVGVPLVGDLVLADKVVAKSKKLTAEAKVLGIYSAQAGSATFFTQSRIASYKLDALRAAVKWAFRQGSFRVTTVAEGNSDVYIPPVLAKQKYITLVQSGHKIGCYIALTC